MREDSLLRHLLVERYTPDALRTIRKVLEQHRTHDIESVSNGLFAASPARRAILSPAIRTSGFATISWSRIPSAFAVNWPRPSIA